MLQTIMLGGVAAFIAIASTCSAVAGPKVAFQTTIGSFTVELDKEGVPTTVENFLGYVDRGFYDDVVFHSVSQRGYKNSKIYAGAYALVGGVYVVKRTGAPIENEADKGLRNMRGTLGMARYPSDPHSATADFYINLQDAPRSNYQNRGSDAFWGYAVFGRVIRGMDVVDKMSAIEPKEKTVSVRDLKGKLRRERLSSAPSRDIIILSARRVE